MGNAVQTAVVKIIGTLDPSVAKSVADANKKFSGLKAGIVATGVVLAGATTAAVAFGKSALDSAAKFETGMSNIATLLDGDTATVNKRIAEMGDDIMGVAKKTGLTTDDLSNGMYQIVSALGDSADATSQLEVAAKAAKAGGATTVDAINLLSAVTKGYGDTSGEAWSKASDLAFQTVKLGQTSFPELAASMGKVVPIASALNISQEELFGSFATLTGVTGSTAEVSTQLKSVFSGLMTPSTALSAKISELGYESANAMLDQLGLIGTLDKLTAACGDDKQAVAKLFSSVEAQTAVLALAGSQTENWVQKTEAMAGAADATSKAFDKSTDNLQGKLDKMKQVFETFKIRVGNILIPIVSNIVENAIPKIEAASDSLMPVFSKVFNSAKPLIEAFGSAIPGAINIAGSVISGAFSAIRMVLPPVISLVKFLGDNFSWIGPIAVGLASGIGILTAAIKISSIATAISANGFKAWAASTKIATTGTKLLAGAQKILNLVMSANPIGIIIAAVIALGTAFVLLYKKCEPFRNFINGIGAGIKKGFFAVVNWFKGLPAKIGKVINNLCKKFPLVSNAVTVVKKSIQLSFDSIKKIFSNVIGFVKNLFTGNWKGAVGNLSTIADSVIGTMKNLFESFSNIADSVVSAVSNKFPLLGSILGGVVDGIKVHFNFLISIFENVIGFIKNVFTGNWKGALENVSNLAITPIQRISGLFDTITNTVNRVLSILKEKFPAIAPIIDNVQATITPIIENIKGVFSGLIDFIKNVFTGNWAGAWENIKSIFSNACNALVGIVKVPFNFITSLLGSLSEKVSSVIASIGERFPVLGSILQTVWNAVTPIIEGIKTAISSIKDVFVNIIDFIKNIFTGQWSAAWENIKNIFGSIWGGLKGLVKAPLNAVISLVNAAIGGLNKLHISIPDWVPGLGGKEFGINIPQIPMLATGGIATQPSICGEGGYPEYVISTDPKYREQNQKTVLEAANAIGALETANKEGSSVRSLFKKFNGKGSSSTVNNNSESTAFRIEFSPVININGNTNNAHSIADEVMRVFDDYAPELADKIKAVLATAREGSYGI